MKNLLPDNQTYNKLGKIYVKGKNFRRIQGKFLWKSIWISV
jgi:hypothetical protein